MDTSQERTFRRFNFEHVIRVRFPQGNAVAEVDAVVRNISLGGLLLESSRLVPHHSSVEFTITVRGGSISRPIQLRSSRGSGAGRARREGGSLGDRCGLQSPYNPNAAPSIVRCPILADGQASQ